VNTQEKVALIRARFIHRNDVFSWQWFDPEKGAGYARQTVGTCPNDPPCPKRQCPHISNLPIGDGHIIQHLSGARTMGMYQLAEDNTVKWLCFDVDIIKNAPEGVDALSEAVKEHTLALARTLVKHLGKGTFLVERSGSKGFHLWVFFSEPIPARLVLALGRWIDGQTPPPNGIAVEVFPKQTSQQGFGNLVKLPLGVHRKTGQRCFFVNAAFEDLPNQWAALQNVSLLDRKDVEEVLRIHNVEAPHSIRTDEVNNQFGRWGIPCISRVMEEGLAPGAKNIGMFRTMAFTRACGYSQAYGEAIAEVLNSNSANPLDPNITQTTIESVFANDYSPFPCGEPLMDQFCTSKCRFFTGKLRDRWVRYGKDVEDAVGVISRD
jgi:hypothetical protein